MIFCYLPLLYILPPPKLPRIPFRFRGGKLASSCSSISILGELIWFRLSSLGEAPDEDGSPLRDLNECSLLTVALLSTPNPSGVAMESRLSWL